MPLMSYSPIVTGGRHMVCFRTGWVRAYWATSDGNDLLRLQGGFGVSGQALPATGGEELALNSFGLGS
jgi:hypothetical protein